MRSSNCREPTISGRVALARVSAQPISPQTCLDLVGDPSAGGIGCFVGTVRSADQGRAVTALCYEAHPRAETRLEEVCEQIAGRDVVVVAAEHRSGHLEIGDLALVVAVSALHRHEALAAATDLIDSLKAQVPIWKEQQFADGTSEWVGCP